MRKPNVRFKGYGYFGDTPAGGNSDLSTLTLSSATGINVPTFTDTSTLNPDNINFTPAPAGGILASPAMGSSVFSNPLFIVGAVILGGALLFTLLRK